MKLLAICGSPRKGNSYKALKEIEDIFSHIDMKADYEYYKDKEDYYLNY